MKHTFFALFSDFETADAAVQELLGGGAVDPEHVSVVVHRDVDPERFERFVLSEGDTAETDALPNAVRGALVGGLAGAVLLGPFGLIGMGPVAGVLFGAILGTVPGAFTGGLAGLGFSDRALKRLTATLKAGDTLVTVQADSFVRERAVENLLERHGARLAEKHLV